jgi:hypothetical protein
VVCGAGRLGGAYGYGLYPVHPDGERGDYHGNPVLSNDPHGRGHLAHSAANLAILRKITLNLIRLEPTEKYRKQLYASCEPDFLLKILLNL